MVETDAAAKRILERFAKAKTDRGTWEGHWDEIAWRVWPNYAGRFNGTSTAPGARNTRQMVDATAAMALPRFASVMESMLTPRNQLWHGLVVLDKGLSRNRRVQEYFETVTDTLFKYRNAPRANFASQVHEVYLSLGSFGTGALMVDDLKWPGEKGLRYRALHLAEVYFLENHQGIIDTMFRRFELTARQAVQQFTLEKLPERIAKAVTENNGQNAENKFWFVHAVEPREDYDPERLDAQGQRFRSCYIAEDDKVVVKEGGYDTFPVPASRYVQAPGETYGRSPAMLALPSIKTLNEQKKTVLKQGQRIVDPVLLAHDDGVLEGFNLKAGAINFGAMTAEGRKLVDVLPTGNLAVAQEMMDAEKQVINDAFLITLFQILVENRPQMTATEVLERAQEKGALLSPTMGRQQSEFLGPMIEREIDVLAKQGLLPEMPQILAEAKAEYDVVYTSPLSRVQKAEQASGLMRLINWSMELYNATQDPSVMDWFNPDRAMPDLADISAVPARWTNTPEEVAMRRAARAQQAQVQQAVDALPAAAGVMKALPKGAAPANG